MIEDDLKDAQQTGLLAAYTELLRDEQFATLMGCLATVYGVTARKVTSIDQRSFKTAKDRLAAFLARTSGWNAKLSRDTRNGSWNRGAVHPVPNVEGREDPPGMERLGGRGDRLRSGVAETSDQPSAESRRAPQVKNRCPSCQAQTGKVWRMRGSLVCPSCVRSKAACKE